MRRTHLLALGLSVALLLGVAPWALASSPTRATHSGWWWIAQTDESRAPVVGIAPDEIAVSREAYTETRQAAVWFDVSDVKTPPQRVVIRLKNVSDSRNGPGGGIQLCPLTTAWTEADGGSWSQRPIPNCRSVVGTDRPGADGYWSFDVTNAVWSWASGASPNNGMGLFAYPNNFNSTYQIVVKDLQASDIWGLPGGSAPPSPSTTQPAPTTTTTHPTPTTTTTTTRPAVEVQPLPETTPVPVLPGATGAPGAPAVPDLAGTAPAVPEALGAPDLPTPPQPSDPGEGSSGSPGGGGGAVTPDPDPVNPDLVPFEPDVVGAGGQAPLPKTSPEVSNTLTWTAAAGMGGSESPSADRAVRETIARSGVFGGGRSESQMPFALVGVFAVVSGLCALGYQQRRLRDQSAEADAPASSER